MILRFRQWSMTARLIALQLLTVAALIGGTLITLYYSISRHLHEDNVRALSNQTALFASWLDESQKQSTDFRSIAKTHTQLLASLPVFARVTAPSGQVLLRSPITKDLDDAIFPAPGQEATDWFSTSGHRFLLAATQLRATPGAAGNLLEIAYDITDDDQLLRRLRQRMELGFGLAVVLSGILTWLIARGVFRPIARLTAATKQVQASHLSAHLHDADWPGELIALAREFAAMLGRLDESFHRLAQFSSDLSHELRTPINNLRGEAEVALSQQRPAEEYRRVLESSLEECARLGRLIDTLLFIAKADHPTESIQLHPHDAAAECRRVVEFFEAIRAERNLSILVRGSGLIAVNADLLRRALNNLVDNAIRHTQPGGRIDLTVREHPDAGIEIEIQDNGPGITAEHLPRVFERFYRSEKSLDQSHATSGFGLGLAIVKSIMDLHGGTVTMTSQVGAGTTVTLFFPIRPDTKITEM